MRTRLKIPTWCRNFRRRPPAPARGKGRTQRQLRRAFLIHGPTITSTTAYDWVFTRHRQPLSHLRRYGVWKILKRIAVPVRKVPPHGAWLWRLKSPMSE
jgi:hypothetical protein